MQTLYATPELARRCAVRRRWARRAARPLIADLAFRMERAIPLARRQARSVALAGSVLMFAPPRLRLEAARLAPMLFAAVVVLVAAREHFGRVEAQQRVVAAIARAAETDEALSRVRADGLLLVADLGRAAQADAGAPAGSGREILARLEHALDDAAPAGGDVSDAWSTAQLELSTARLAHGDRALAAGDWDRAIEHYSEAARREGSLAVSAKAPEPHLEGSMRALFRIAHAAREAGNATGAIAALERNARHAARLHRLRRRDRDSTERLTQSLLALGDALFDSGRTEAAAQVYDEAQGYAMAGAAAFPHSAPLVRAFARSANRAADAHLRNGRDERVLATLSEAISTVRDLRRREGRSDAASTELAFLLARLGFASPPAERAGFLREALAILAEAEGRSEDLVGWKAAITRELAALDGETLPALSAGNTR